MAIKIDLRRFELHQPTERAYVSVTMFPLMLIFSLLKILTSTVMPLAHISCLFQHADLLLLLRV